MADRFGISLKYLAHLTQAEILSLFSGEDYDLVEVKKRYDKGFSLLVEDSKSVCKHGLDIDLLDSVGFKLPKKQEGVGELKGVCASKGKVSGRVVIVHTIHDILKVKKGDVLVAFTTHSDYLPAMQLASAIVTQEGGLLSHAAIVSRELKIPCVVSVKGVMDTLCLGEMVEVDADKGVVKRLE